MQIFRKKHEALQESNCKCLESMDSPTIICNITLMVQLQFLGNLAPIIIKGTDFLLSFSPIHEGSNKDSI